MPGNPKLRSMSFRKEVRTELLFGVECSAVGGIYQGLVYGDRIRTDVIYYILM